jgi:hypothetical protein
MHKQNIIQFLSILFLLSFATRMQAQENYRHLIMYGQSLSVGAQSYPLLTQGNIANAYMMGNQIWINYGNSNTNEWNPLTGSIVSGTPDAAQMTRSAGLIVECPLFSIVNHIQRKQESTDKYLVTSCGYHGRSIEQLSKGSNDAGLYNDFLKSIDNASVYAQSRNINLTCPALFWMQGENNYTNISSAGYTAGTASTTDKKEYTTWLIRLKNDMQQDVMSRYNQTEKPLFITYQTGGQYIKNKEATISMAQLEASNKYRDIVCAGPVYPMTDRGGHLDPNGYRWYGEMMGKVYYKTKVLGEDFKPLQPYEFSRTDNPKQLKIKFLVPQLPLVLDDKIVQKQTGYGFELYANGSRKTITGVSVENDCVYLTCDSNLDGQKIEIVYAGQNTSGHGNLRDSDDYGAFDDYADLDAKNEANQYLYPRASSETTLRPDYEPKDSEGVIYGKTYPLHNFCVNFYYALEATENACIAPSLNNSENDYLQVILYGQSLGMGWECPQAITTTALDGNYMLGNSPLMKYNNGQPVLNPLTATQWEQGGEQPVVACVNAFSRLYRENINPSRKFIGMTGGEGGQTIERLSKECTNGGFYASTFTKILDNTVSALSDGQSVTCPAIVFMQGEYNCNNSSWYTGRGMTPGSDGTTNKEEYKKLLLQLKNNMQNDIKTKYGQTQTPLFFIYQTSGNYLKMKEMPIAMAQYEFASENEDVILLNPHYAMPDYNGGHLSTNGYRWYGEMMGNILYDVLLENKNYKPVYPENISITDKSINIDYHVPAPPLVLDSRLNAQAANFGFAVYEDNVSRQIEKVEVSGNNRIVITCNTSLTGKVEVVYAGNTTAGTGNVRDSYNRASLYTYFDDSSQTKKESYTPQDENGNKIYGQTYPMHNWSVGFYHEINGNGNTGFDGEGSGTADSPYKITDAAQLNQVRNSPGAYYQLENDVDLSEWTDTNSPLAGWDPIDFGGDFNGNGHIISGLWVERSSSENVGLFGSLSGAKIKKLGVVVAPGKRVAGKQNTGIIAGQATSGTNVSIEQCYVSGEVVSVAANAGSILGMNFARLTVKQSYSEGTVNGIDGCGGITGNTYGSSSNLLIEQCYTLASVDGGGKSAGGMLGGFSYSNSSVPASPIVTLKNSAVLSSELFGAAASTGRLVGYEKNIGKIVYENNSAYDNLKINGNMAAGGTTTDKNGAGKSAGELTLQSTYSPWNFNSDWKMGNGNYQLPVLLQLSLSGQPQEAVGYLGSISGIDDIKTDVNIRPNPVTDALFIDNKPEKAEVLLFDAMGCLLLKTTRSEINMSEYPAGIYIVKVGADAIDKIIVNH